MFNWLRKKPTETRTSSAIRYLQSNPEARRVVCLACVYLPHGGRTEFWLIQFSNGMGLAWRKSRGWKNSGAPMQVGVDDRPPASALSIRCDQATDEIMDAVVKQLTVAEPMADANMMIRDGLHYYFMYCDKDLQRSLSIPNPIEGTATTSLIERLTRFFGQCGIDIS